MSSLSSQCPIRLKAPAKINLLLRVTGKRPDKFHELVTLFHPVTSLCDTLAVDLESAPGISISCRAPGVPADSSNLAVKAAAAFAEKRKIAPSWHIELEKAIPAAAGMGGGSSDAGTLLQFLNERYPGLSAEEMNRLACQIGADVPFFLNPSDTAARGVGEKLTPAGILPMPPMLAVYPAFPVSAAWAYVHLQKMTPPARAEEELALLIEALKQKEFRKAASLCANDLEHALFAKFPLLSILKRELEEKNALCVHISGSGPTLWAMFESGEERAKASSALAGSGNTESGIKIMEL